MTITQQLLLLFSISFISEILSNLLPFIFPSSLMAMLLLFILLLSKYIKIKDIEPVGVFLQKHISIFFIPPAVNLIDEWDFIKDKFLILIFISVVSFLVTFLVTGFTATLIINLQEKLENKNK